jgi:chromosome segregation ATPase
MTRLLGEDIPFVSSSLSSLFAFFDMKRYDAQDTASLQAEVQNLLDELKDVGLKNEEILAEKDSDYQTIQSLSKEVKEYKRKYEQAKTELRNFKGAFASFSARS